MTQGKLAGKPREINAGKAVKKKAARRPPLKQSRFKGLKVEVGPQDGGELVQRISLYRNVI